jgi:hypothetical protein
MLCPLMRRPRRQETAQSHRTPPRCFSQRQARPVNPEGIHPRGIHPECIREGPALLGLEFASHTPQAHNRILGIRIGADSWRQTELKK